MVAFSFGYLIGILIVFGICGAVTKSINNSRGREGGFWWGFFLGVIGIIIVACRPNDVSTKTEVRTEYIYVNNDTGKEITKQAEAQPENEKNNTSHSPVFTQYTPKQRPQLTLDNDTLFSRAINGTCVVDHSKPYTFCSFCDSRVPSDSAKCPSCGVKFVNRSEHPELTGDFTK